MAFLRELLLILAFASYVQGSEVELDLSSASRDSFDVVEFETGPAFVTRITPKLGVHVNRITDTLDGVWSPLSKNFSVKSFEIHQRSGHNSIGHLSLLEKQDTSPSGSQGDDNSHQNQGESLSENVIYSSLYFTKRDRGWFPLTKYHFDVLKDDMESLDSTLDLHNFSDSLVSVSLLGDRVTRELLLARRLSRVTRVNHNGDLVWSSRGTELFKSAFLSYNTMNKLVLVKMTLTTPNATYDPLDEKSSRYYLDRTIYFYRDNSIVWKTVNETFYDETLERLRTQFSYLFIRFHKLTLDLLPMLNGSDSYNPLYYEFRVEKKEYRGIKVVMVRPLGEATLTVVKSGDSLLWVSENNRTYCRDVHLYDLGDNSTLVDLCLASNPSDTCQYMFFKLESGPWSSVSQDNYKHLLNNDEISVVLDLNAPDPFFCTRASYKRNGIPVTQMTANNGYYFDKVKELELELWNSTRFLKCKKAFHVNLNNFNFISLQIEDPLNNTSHLLYYQKISQPTKDSATESTWMPITEAVHSSLMHSLLVNISFDFDLTEFISVMMSKHSLPFDPKSFPEINLKITNKDYHWIVFVRDNVPIAQIYPAFTSHLANVREGSNVIWSSKPNRKVIFLEFNYSEQPSMVLLFFSDENGLSRTSYYSRVNGKWISVTVDEFNNYFGKVSTLQDQKFFTLDIGKLLPSNKYKYQFDHLSTPPSCLIEPHYGHKIDKLVDGAETIWSFNSFPEASTPYGRIGNDDHTRAYEDLVHASFVPYDDPKFVTTLTLSKSHHIYLNHYLKQDGVWKSVNTSEYFEKLDKYSAEYYQGEEIVDLSDVFKGERRDYYQFVDSSYYGMDHYGVLKFTDKVERLSIYVNGVHLYKFPKATYLKELTFFPSNQPKVISLQYQSPNQDSNFLYFSHSDFDNADAFVKILNQYVQVDEQDYTKQFEKLLMLNKYTTLDLSTYYKMVKDFEETNSDERDLVSYIHEKLNNSQTNSGKTVDSPLNHSVYNYLGFNLVVVEINPYYVLKGVKDGTHTVTALNFYPSTKIYFTLNKGYYLSIYYRDAHLQDLKTLNYEKWGSYWSHMKNSFHHGLQVLISFASKPVSVDLFHLRCGHELNLVSSQSTSGNFTNTLSSKPGYQIKLIYYNSVQIYNTDNGLSKKIGLEDPLENVLEITFFPLVRPKLIRITSNTNSTIINKYYKVTNLFVRDSPNPSTTSIITSINVFDYYSLLESVGRVNQFLVDITELCTTDDYRLSNHALSSKLYLILTPNKGKNLVLLTQGEKVIWEAQDELVNYVMLYPRNKPSLVLIYYKKSDREGVYHYRYMFSVNKWVESTEDYALDKFMLRNENLTPITLDLSTLSNKSLEHKDHMSNSHLNLYRKNIYGLLFTIVKPSFSSYIVAVKHNDKILFDINSDQNSFSDHSNTILSAVYAFKDDPKILALNIVKNFVPSQAYFRKNDEGVWEEISSPEYGKFLFMLKRFTMNPVVLDIDNPNPHFFTTFLDRSNKNFTMTRITPMDGYKISKVVRSNSSKAKDLKFDLDQKPVQPVEEIFAVQDKTVFYVEYTDGNPSLLRVYYNTDMMFQVQKAYFVLEEGVYKATTEENFNSLMSFAKSAGTQVKYNLDPYYRDGSPVYNSNSYEEIVETVYNYKIDVVYPNFESNITPIMFKEVNVWEAHPHYQTLSIVSYPSKDPNQMMVKFSDLLKNVVYSQYYKKTGAYGPSERIWKSSILYSNTVFDRNVKVVDFDLSDTKVHTSLTVFSFEREGLYTTVVLPNKGTRVTSISIQNRKIWTPNQGNSTLPSEELVKFYFTPSIDPRVLVVYYRDSDGHVRLKDFARELVSLKWEESYSKFMSSYLDLLDSSLSLNLNSFDKSKFILSNYYKYGFKFVLLYPLLSTNVAKVFSKPSDSASDLTDSELIWMSDLNKECFSLNFAPPEDPKVLLLSYSEGSLLKSDLYYKDSDKGWTLDTNNSHSQFVKRLLTLENAFVYRLEDANSSLPSEFYTYEYTEAFGVRFAVCTPKSGKNLVSVTYNSMSVYDVKKGERILDVLSTQPNKPDHVILMLDTNKTNLESSNPTIIYKYLKKVISWKEVGKTEFLESLMDNLSSHFSPPTLSTDLHNQVLARLSVETSHDSFLDNVNDISTLSDYEHFTLDLANYNENHRLAVRHYVESTVPRTVLRVKRKYLLTRLVHSDQFIWTSDNSSTHNDRFVTHVYFAPTQDPKVLTLFFSDCHNRLYSLRFMKENVWTEFNGLCTTLTNDSKLFAILNKFVLDIHLDSMRYSNTLFKKELVYENDTYFMKISPKENVDVVKLMCKEFQIWDKGEYDNFKSVLIYPINTPKFAKLYLGTNNGSHFFYFSRTNDYWAAQTEPEYKSSLKRYFSHSSDDFEPVDLSNTKNYFNRTDKLNSFYVNLHKLSFASVSPRFDYKISKVLFSPSQSVGDSDLNDFDFGPFNFHNHEKTEVGDVGDSDLKVLFEPTSNQDIRVVSFAPENDPKFVSITYTSISNLIIPPTSLPKLQDSPYSPNQSPETVSGPTPTSSVSFSGDYAYLTGVPGYLHNYDGMELSSPFYLSVNTNHYYLNEGVWSITDDATFRSLCLKWADEQFERKQPFDLDLDDLQLNKENYDTVDEELSGVYFTKITPKTGFEFSHILQNYKVIYRQKYFPIISISLFPLNKPMFLKISHKMSPSLINNYFFVRFYPYGLSQRDYPTFKKALLDYINSPEYSPQSKVSKPLLPQTAYHPTQLVNVDGFTTDLRKSTLVLYGKNLDILYYLDYNNDSKSGYSLKNGTKSNDIPNVVTTYSGKSYSLNYYLVSPNQGFDFTKLYDKGDIVFDLGEVGVLKSVLLVPTTNPTHILFHYTSDQHFNFFELYHKQQKWVPSYDLLLKYKLKNITKYHLSPLYDFEYPESQSLKEPKVSDPKSPKEASPSSPGLSSVELQKTPTDKKEDLPSVFSLKPVPTPKFMLHGNVMLSDDEKLEFNYDLLKNVALPQDSNGLQTGLSDLGFKFYIEDEKHYRLVFVDEPNHNITKLTVNDQVLLDLTNTKPYTTTTKEFSYDIESRGFTCENFEVFEGKFDDKDYVVVKVTQGTLSKVLEGESEVWDSKGKLVERFAYYPTLEPDHLLFSYNVQLENGESVTNYEYMHKVSNKWVEMDQESQLQLDADLKSNLFSSNPQETKLKLFKGVLLMPSKNPVKLHVWYTENNFDKFVSFSRSLGKWTHSTLVFNDLVYVKLKFVTAQTRSDTVVFTGTETPTLSDDTNSRSRKILFESVSVNKHFLVDVHEKDNFLYLPLNNFLITNVSYGRHCFFKNADPQTDAANTKKVFAVHLTVENQKGPFYAKVNKLTVLSQDLLANVHVQSWVRDSTNKWSRFSLTDNEVSTLKERVRDVESRHSQKTKIDTTSKCFTNFLTDAEREQGAKDSLNLSGRVLVPDRGPAFFNYDLATDEMYTYVSSLKTLFYSYSKEDAWNSFKVLAVKQGYEVTVLKTSDRVIYSTSTNEKHKTKAQSDRIIAVYLSPSTKPDSVCLYLSDRLGAKKLVFFRKGSYDQSKAGADEWSESTLLSSQSTSIKFKLDEAVSRSTSLRLECFDYSKVLYFGGSFISHRQLTPSEYFVNTDSDVTNTPFKGFYSIVSDNDNCLMLIPIKTNKVFHIKYSTETLFSLESQFHTVRALMMTPRVNPDTLIVYYNDDENNDYYSTFTKLLAKTPAASSLSTSSTNSTAQKLFANPNKIWRKKPFMFFSSFGSIKEIHRNLEMFENNNPSLVNFSRERTGSSHYNLALTLTGVYTSGDGTTKEFVFFFDPDHKGSAYVFEDDQVVEHKGAFDVVFKNSQFMNYLHVKSRPSYKVESIMMDSQVLMDLDGTSDFDSVTLTPALNPTTILVTSTDTISSFYYYFMNKENTWLGMGYDMTKYIKMKVLLHNASEEISQSDSHVDPAEPEVKRPSPAEVHNFEFDLSNYDVLSEVYTLKKDSLNGHELMLGRTKSDSNVQNILDSNLLVWTNLANFRVVNFCFSPPKDPNLLSVAYMFNEQEVYDFFHKTGGVWQPCSSNIVPGLLTHISNPDLANFALDLSTVDEASEHYKLTKHIYDDFEIVSGNIAEGSVLASVVDKDLDVLPNSYTRTFKAQRFVYSQPKNPTYFGVYFTQNSKEAYELYKKHNGKWSPYFDMSENRKFLLAELLPYKDVDQFNTESKFFTPENQFYYNTSHSNNTSNKHCEVQRQTTEYLDYVFVKVHKNQRLLKVLNNNLTVWVPKDTMTEVSRFMYYPPDDPTYFSIAYRTPSVNEDNFEYFYRSDNKWIPYSDPINIPQTLKRPLYSYKDPTSPSSSKVVFDLTLDLSSDFYKYRYERYLTLYKNLLFETFVPKPGFEVSEITSSFNVIYSNLLDENITRISLYPKNDPKLLLVELKTESSSGTKKILRKFVLKDTWVVNEDEFDNLALSYLNSEQKSVSLDLRQLTKENATFEHFLVVKESLNGTFETLVVTPILGKRIVSIFDGPNNVWSSDEASVDSCYLFPLESPELLSVLSTDLAIKYYSKLSGRWSEVSSVSFDYLSSFYSGTPNVIEISRLSKFETTSSFSNFNCLSTFNYDFVSSLETKTKYNFLKTGLVKYNSLIFGVASLVPRKFESDESPTSQTPQVLALTYYGEPLFRLNNDQKFLDLIFYPMEKPSMVQFSFLQEGKHHQKFFLRSASKKHEWYEVDNEHFDNLFSLLSTHKLFNPAPASTLKPFQFDLNCEKGGDGFVLTKLSPKDHYYSVYVSETHRLSDIKENGVSVYQVPETDFVYNLYYNLDPENTHLTLTYTSTSPEFPPDSLGYVYFEKNNEDWVKSYSFIAKLLDYDQLLSSTQAPSKPATTPTPMDSNEFVYDMNKDKDSTANFELKVETMQGVKLATVLPRTNKKLVHLVDSQVKVWSSGPQDKCSRVLYAPFEQPKAAGVVYLTGEQQTVKYFLKNPDGTWNETSPSQFIKVLIPEIVNKINFVNVSLDFSNLASQVISSLEKHANSLQTTRTKTARSNFLDKDISSFMVYPVPSELHVSKLYYHDELVYSSTIEDIRTLHLYASKSDFYLRVTTDFLEHKTSHYFHTTLRYANQSSNVPSTSNSLPSTSHSSDNLATTTTASVGCEKFTFDLAASNETNKFFTLHRGVYLGHNEVSVKVHSGYVLSRLVDGKTLLWEQTGHVFLVNFGYMPEKNPSHLCLGLYCAKGHKLWYTFYFKKGGKWHLYTHEDKPPVMISNLANYLFLEYGTNDLVQYNQKENQKPALVCGKWQKIEKEEFYNNFLHLSILKEYVAFDISLIPDVGKYEVKEGFEFGHPIRISNPMPNIHVGIISHGNKQVWLSNSINEHVKSIITVHDNHYKHLANSNTKLIQLYVKDRDKISLKYFKKSDNDHWTEIVEKEYANLYDKLSTDFKSLKKELKLAEHEPDKLDSDAETVASTTHLSPLPDDLLVTVSYTDKELGSLTSSQLKLNDSHQNFFVYTVDKLQTVYVPISGHSVKKLSLDDFTFFKEDEAPRDLLAFITKLNTDHTLQRVILFFRDTYQLVHKAFVHDKGNWVAFSLLPEEESYLADLVLNSTEKMKLL